MSYSLRFEMKYKETVENFLNYFKDVNVGRQNENVLEINYESLLKNGENEESKGLLDEKDLEAFFPGA